MHGRGRFKCKIATWTSATLVGVSGWLRSDTTPEYAFTRERQTAAGLSLIVFSASYYSIIRAARKGVMVRTATYCC